MDANDDLPGQFKMILFLLSGLAIALPLLAIPKKVLARIGKIPYLSPNWLSFWRLPLTLIGFGIYFLVDAFIGYCIIVFAFTLDRLDGKVAVALDELGDPRYPGKTAKGEWLDPLIDKLTVPTPFIVFSMKGMLVWWLVGIMIVSEIAGTVIREPLLSWKLLSGLRKYVRKQGASGIGKTKIVMQFSCLLICLPLDQGWMDVPLGLTNVTLALSCVLGILSVVSRLQLNSKLNAAVDDVTNEFNHNE